MNASLAEVSLGEFYQTFDLLSHWNESILRNKPYR
jgi:hypothetical protein